MRVALYDPIVTGHHPLYASFISRSLTERGADVLYLTPDRNDSVRLISETGADVQQVGHGGNGLFRTLVDVLQGYKTAVKWGADIFHHLFIDTRELSITTALANSNLPTFFTLFNPHYTRDSTFIKKVYAQGCLTSLGMYSNKNSFKSLFVHAPRIKERILSKSMLLDGPDISVIPDPVELPEHELSKEEARSALNIHGPNPVFLFFGRLRPEKGPSLLLEAIKRTNREATFVIAGAEDEVGREEIEEANRLARPRIDSRVGFIPESEIYPLFFASDAVVLPYTSDYVGTSGVLQRAAAAGRPVIATDVGEIGEITRKNGLGTVVQPDVHELSECFEVAYPFDKGSESSARNYAESQSAARFGELIFAEYKKCLSRSEG